MIIIHIAGMTRELGRSQGFIPLPLRDDLLPDKETGTQLHTMTTAWEPAPDEIARLVNGAPLYLTIYGSRLPIGTPLHEHILRGGHPPVMLSVGPVPVDEEDAAILSDGSA